MKKRTALTVIMSVVLLFCRISAAHAVNSDDASGFVSLTDVVPDAILEIRYFSSYNFVGERIDGYEEPLALVTREAAEALLDVSNELAAKGYRLKIYDAYRPQAAVDHFARWARDPSDVRMKEYFYPELSKRVLFTEGYIASRSGHSRGSTVDLTLFDMAQGEEADMGGSFDYFGELSHPDCRNITEEQYQNRMLLRNTMMAHGFKPISTEWWHFTLKNEPYRNTYFTFPVNSDEVDFSSVSVRLERGMENARVRYYQELLVGAGYLTGAADGIFGAQTEAAVRALQAEHGIEPTGIITGVEARILNPDGG